MKYKENENVLLVEHGFDFRIREKTTTLSHGTVTKINTSSIYVKTDSEKSDNIIRFKNVKNPMCSDWAFGQIELFHSEDEYTKYVSLKMNVLLDKATAHIDRVNRLKNELDYSEINDIIDVLDSFNNEASYIAEE